MEKINLIVTGTRPFMMHGDLLSNPLAAETREHKALTSKRIKTDDDHLAIAQSEFRSSLYWSEESGPFIPGWNLYKSIVEGARLSKLGKSIERAVDVLEDELPILYSGPRDIKGLWEGGFYDARSVKVSAARLMRFRPCFKSWSIKATVVFDQQVIDKHNLLKSIIDAGEFVGIGDYRPRFGRFEVKEV